MIRRRLAVIAFTALAILALQPVCAAAEPVAVAGGAESCCAFMDDAPTVSTASAEPRLAKLPPLAPPQLTWRQPALTESRGVLADSAQPPPRSLPYHARSARILL